MRRLLPLNPDLALLILRVVLGIIMIYHGWPKVTNLGGTIEGMANGNELHPLQQTFLELNGTQCGICTPGILIAARELLKRNPDPTETEIRYWLAGNLCRCTGYDKIIRAVLDAAAELRGG